MLINAIIRWCLKNPFLVLVAVVALMGGGWYALRNTPVDAIPDIGEKQVIVVADWPGRSPQDVDDQVTYPLTVALDGHARREGDPRDVGLRLLDGLRDLPRRRRLLLGAQPRAGAAERRREGLARRRRAGARARRHRAGPGLLVHGRRPGLRSGRTAHASRTGTSATSSTRSKACRKSPRSAGT